MDGVDTILSQKTLISALTWGLRENQGEIPQIQALAWISVPFRRLELAL